MEAEGHDLGCGVRVTPGSGGRWHVQSPRLVLPWRPRSGRISGSAIVWHDELYEAVAVGGTPDGRRWILQPWPENEAMRGVFHLDASSIQRIEDDLRDARRRRRRWWWALPALPALGTLPGRTQEAWQREWGFPAAPASLLSALSELALAAVGGINVIAESLAGTGVLPSALAWLGWLSPMLLVEAVIRLKHLGANQEPIGSVIGLPFGVFHTSRPMLIGSVEPELGRFDEAEGVLELWSPIHRADWNLHGVLRYRDMPFRLDRLQQMDGGWLYTFRVTGDEDLDEAVRLRLDPSVARGAAGAAAARHRVAPADRPGFLATTAVTAMACMAPADLQRRWADHLRVQAPLLTVFGAGAELVGGLVNLRSLPGPNGWWTALDLAFMIEGIARLALLVVRGQPVGSVLGLALRPLLERWMAVGREP